MKKGNIFIKYGILKLGDGSGGLNEIELHPFDIVLSFQPPEIDIQHRESNVLMQFKQKLHLSLWMWLNMTL